MSEVERCHEIDEFENGSLGEEVFSFNSSDMNINEVNKIHKIGVCNVFLPLSECEMELFAKNGIDGDSLRKIGKNEYVNTYFGIKYSFNKNGTLMRHYNY